MYLLGVRRKVRGVDRLRQRHKEFQLRMMAGPSAAAASAPPAATQARPALGDIKTKGRVASGSSRDPFSTLKNGTSTPASRGGNARIQVFVDDGGAEAADGNEWPELDSREAGRKENTQAPVPAQGQKLKQKIMIPNTPKVDVYVDEVHPVLSCRLRHLSIFRLDICNDAWGTYSE